MSYVVVWPRARFLVDGERVVVTKGNAVPKGVDERQLHQLVLVGAIVASSPPATTPEAAALVDPVDPGEVERPAASAAAGVWRDYADHLGIDHKALRTKADVVAEIVKYEAEQEAAAAAAGETRTGDDDETGAAPSGDPDEPTIS